ncbi:MAG: diacylglycerol kinase [Gammaproteobacteria bacterium]|nr:diacylglycerol kinase [Gammaproteobacteria bacterium]NNJ51537.1 diacylglycerol kinase [Gammaproteobacteria bacterium]
MAKTGATGFTRIINAAGYSWAGLKAAYTNEAAFRQELWLVIVLSPVAIIFGPSYADKAVLLASLIFILLIEILNSALEAVVDRFGDEIHPLSGRAKDMGSAAVLLAFFITGLIWFSVFSEMLGL